MPVGTGVAMKRGIDTMKKIVTSVVVILVYAEILPAASGAAGVAPSSYYNHDPRDALI